MGRRSDSAWRDRAAAELVIGALDAAAPKDALLLGERGAELPARLTELGARVTHWDRRLGGAATSVEPWPEVGAWDWVGVRLPKAKEELEMLLGAASARAASEGAIWVYGAGDEGVGSITRRLADRFESVETIAVGGRCRVVELRAPIGAERGELSAWRATLGVADGLPADGWVSYPGCFAHGRLDRGTAVLLAAVPRPSPGDRILDFACGTGAIARHLMKRAPDLHLTLLDHDALSLAAATENVPGAEVVLAGDLSALGDRRFDTIVANPPYHVGKAGTRSVLENLCASAHGYLAPGGVLMMVVQQTHALAPILERHFARVSVSDPSDGFRIWECAKR